MEVPTYLKSTYIMLFKTFPNRISEEDYWAVIYLLYDYMADENLALVMSYFVDNSYGIIANDIYKVSQINFDSTLLEKIKVRLDKYGFEEWKMQD